MGTISLTNAKITLKMSGTLRNTLRGGEVASVACPSLNYSQTLEDGVGASQADRSWQGITRSIASGAQETIDLSNMAGIDVGAGAGLDALGQAVSMEEIVAIVITNDNAVTTAGELEVIPADSEGWTPIGSHTSANGGALRGQGLLLKVQPAAIAFEVGALSHRVTLRAVGGAITYSMYLLARSELDTSSSSSISSSSSSSSSASSISTSSSSSSSISDSSSSISTSSSSSSPSSSSSSSVSSSSSSSESSSSLSSESSQT